jgi:hypothetical protein
VLDALDLDLGDGAALQAGQEDAPQAVADGVAEATLERLDVELAVRVGQLLAGADDPTGEFETTPTDAPRAGTPIAFSGQRSASGTQPDRWERPLVQVNVQPD